MNKYLMLTAASLFATAATASAAGCFSFTFYSAGGGAYCDGGIVQTGVDGGAQKGAVRAWVHTNNNCTGSTSQGYGLLSKVADAGKLSLMSDDFIAKNYGTFSTAISYTLPKGFGRFGDKTWSLWVGMSGVTFFEADNGVLVNRQKCDSPASSHGRKSTLDGVKAIIAERRRGKVVSQ